MHPDVLDVARGEWGLPWRLAPSDRRQGQSNRDLMPGPYFEELGTPEWK
jgi:hypothetical protein